MKNLLLFLFIIFCTGFRFSEYKDRPISVCLSPEEKKLYDMIMAYRKQNKLPAIPLSVSLSYVAQSHAKDLMENNPGKDPCNMHSWSKNGKWKDCCYTPDHKQSKCMWEKPRELTSYPSDGFEIAHFYSRGAKAEDALDGWKISRGHNPVLLNKGIWKESPWEAIGIGIYKNYACVWFGNAEDPEGKPKYCQ